MPQPSIGAGSLLPGAYIPLLKQCIYNFFCPDLIEHIEMIGKYYTGKKVKPDSVFLCDNLPYQITSAKLGQKRYFYFYLNNRETY